MKNIRAKIRTLDLMAKTGNALLIEVYRVPKELQHLNLEDLGKCRRSEFGPLDSYGIAQLDAKEDSFKTE